MKSAAAPIPNKSMCPYAAAIGNKKNRLYVKDHKGQCIDVILHLKLNPAIPHRLNTTLIGFLLNPVRFARQVDVERSPGRPEKFGDSRKKMPTNCQSVNTLENLLTERKTGDCEIYRKSVSFITHARKHDNARVMGILPAIMVAGNPGKRPGRAIIYSQK